jgi:hypothetical protein
MSSDRQSEAFRPGEVAWFDFPHLDTAKKCCELPCTYKTLYRKSKPPNIFLLVMEGKNRAMLVLARPNPVGPQGPRRYTLLKCTSRDKYRDKPGYLPIPPHGYVSTVDIHTLPDNLATGRKGVIDPLKLKQIENKVRGNLGFGPPSQSTPVPSA